MNELHQLKDTLGIVEKKINITFQNKDLLLLSFVHRSYVNENKKIINDHNERLEFLGDTTLNLIVSDYLYNTLTSYSEGKLSHIRSRLVDASSCAEYYKILGLNEFVLLGRGEKAQTRGKITIFSDAFEALIGAIYLDKGFLVVKKFIIKNFENYFQSVTINPEMDYKGKLQEFSQRTYQTPPVYIVLKEEGPEHLKIFHVVVKINDDEIGFGYGKFKKN